MKNVIATLENRQLLVKLNIHLPYDPAIPSLGTCLREVKTYAHTKSVHKCFKSVLHIITKTWKAPKYPLRDEWINKLWYGHPMDYYSAVKRNEYATTWMNLRTITLNERRWFQNVMYCLLPFIWHFWKDKNIVIENRSMVRSGERVWGQSNSMMEFLWDDETILYTYYGGGYMNFCIC